jgi:hypothetical protein
MAAKLTQIETRVTILEAAVFPKPDSGPGFGMRLESLDKRLRTLEKDLELKTKALDAKYSQKIKELVEITAELRILLDELNKKRHFKLSAMEA